QLNSRRLPVHAAIFDRVAWSCRRSELSCRQKCAAVPGQLRVLRYFPYGFTEYLPDKPKKIH
ncbi:MAG: hypothetical protein WC091_25230, partial [Sulfuricellaceae bacterium]